MALAAAGPAGYSRVMSAPISICITCDRYAIPTDGTPTRGARLAAAVEARIAERGGAAGAVEVRRVDCLDGCPNPVNAALKARGKPLQRFSGLGPAEIDALIDAALAYRADPAGRLSAEALGPGLTRFWLTRSR